MFDAAYTYVDQGGPTDPVVDAVLGFLYLDDADSCTSGAGVGETTLGCGSLGLNIVPGANGAKWGFKGGGKLLKWLKRILGHGDEAAGAIPKLVVGEAQLGAKTGKHAADFGLDASNAADRATFLNRINTIASNPDEVRIGAWNPTAGGGAGYVFFAEAGDVVVATGAGDFVTVLRGGVSNNWFQGATVVLP